MSGLDIFALVVLVILVIMVVAIWVFLSMMPGKIAKKRQHPQAEAITVCGWLGGLTLGILWPVAFVWAYTKPGNLWSSTPVGEGGQEGSSAVVAELHERIEALEAVLQAAPNQRGGSDS
jgi:fatty acid desaturase